jgi:hypothetical protein
MKYAYQGSIHHKPVFPGSIIVSDLNQHIDKPLSPLSSDFVQIGSNIDIEIATRLSRAMWRALGGLDAETKQRLNTYLKEEIESLNLQNEIDRRVDVDRGLALEQLLSQYLLPED